MEVIALETGFYNGVRVRKGTKFHAADGEKAKWFKPVATPPAEKPPAEPTGRRQSRASQGDGDLA